jgi:hypothetical protein
MELINVARKNAKRLQKSFVTLICATCKRKVKIPILSAINGRIKCFDCEPRGQWE